MQCLGFQVGIEVTHKPSLNVNSSCFCCHPLRSWSLAHTPWGLWHFIHCIPVHPRSFANPDGFTTHAGGPASTLASWFLGSSTPVTHCHVAIAPHSQSHDLNHVLPGAGLKSHPLVPNYNIPALQLFSPLLLGRLVFRSVETSSSLTLFFPYPPVPHVFTSLPNQPWFHNASLLLLHEMVSFSITMNLQNCSRRFRLTL